MKHILIFILLFSLSLYPSREEKLKKLNFEIKSIKKKIVALNKESGSLLNDLYRIELKYKKVVSENNRINHLLRVTNSTIKKKEAEKRGLENEISKSKKDIKNTIRILNKVGKAGNFKIFSNVKDITQLFRNYYLFISLINMKIKEIGRIKILLEKLLIVRKELYNEKKRLGELRKIQKKKLQEILTSKKKKTSFIDSINSDRKKHLRMLDELKVEAKKLTNLLKKKVDRFDLPELDLRTIKGKLKWPVKGEIISGFGKKKSTKFNTYIINNGIEIKPYGKSKIKATFDGVIIFMDYFKGYGDIIIVQHSKELLSIYGHCSKFLRKKGEYVLSGDVIGIAGDSGSTHGKSVYFEIRKNTVAENPLSWLEKK